MGKRERGPGKPRLLDGLLEEEYISCVLLVDRSVREKLEAEAFEMKGRMVLVIRDAVARAAKRNFRVPESIPKDPVRMYALIPPEHAQLAKRIARKKSRGARWVLGWALAARYGDSKVGAGA